MYIYAPVMHTFTKEPHAFLTFLGFACGMITHCCRARWRPNSHALNEDHRYSYDINTCMSLHSCFHTIFHIWFIKNSALEFLSMHTCILESQAPKKLSCILQLNLEMLPANSCHASISLHVFFFTHGSNPFMKVLEQSVYLYMG